LTPWQKENLRYQKEHGEQPGWSPSVISGNHSDEDQEQYQETDTEEHQAELDESETNASDSVPRSFADRLPNIKKYRNRILWRRLLLIIGVLLIPLLIVLYYVSPLSKLASITVVGNDQVPTQSIIEHSELTTGEELWPQYFDREQTEQAIKKALPRVKNVQVTITSFNQLKVKVSEYHEVALLASDNQYSPILESGAVLKEPSDQPVEGLPILESFSDQSKIKEVLTAYQQLNQEIREGISQIKYTPRKSNDELLTIYMNDGNQVIVNISNMVSQMQYYPQIVKDLKEDSIIDMEVGIFTYPISNTKESKTSTEQSTEGDS
jgi:cell division protein FtsQ